MKSLLRDLISSVYGERMDDLAKRIGIHDKLVSLYAAHILDEITITIDGTSATFLISTKSEFDRFQTLKGERPILEHLLNNIRPEDIFYDVGANVGLYTCLVAQEVGDDQVVAVEPHPANVKRLKKNLKKNGYSATVYEAAVGSKAGTTMLEVRGDAAGEGEHSVAIASGNDLIEVKAITASELRRSSPSPDIIKIDVEGGEKLVLDGLEPVLGECRLLYCEIHPERLAEHGSSPAEVHQLMTSHGFKSTELMKRNNQSFVLFER